MEEIALERKENEDMLKQTTMSLESNLEDTLRREKARATEELTMRTSELEDHIVTLSRQLKVAEAKMAELQNAGTSLFVCVSHTCTDIISYKNSLWYTDSFSDTAFFSRAYRAT